MEALTGSLDLLSWPTKAVNAVRGLLADLNVPLPAMAAQALALVVLLLIVAYLVRGLLRAESGSARLALGVGAVAAGVAGLVIAWTWVDAVAVPPSRQIVGSVEGRPLAAVRIDLLDYRGESIAATVDRDLDSGMFSITYAPEFADPPSTVVFTADGCRAERRIALRRPQLKQGAPIGVRLDCGEGEG